MSNQITEASGLGQAVTPEQWGAFVLEQLQHESVILKLGARQIPTDSKQIHIPRLTSNGTVGWFSELEEISTDAPSGNDLVLTPRKVAALALLSNESITDSDPDALDVAGQAMMRAVALEVDAAILHGAGVKEPTGILEGSLPVVYGDVSYENIVRAAGKVRAAGGVPDTVFLHPTDMTELQLQADLDLRPLIQPDASQGAAPTVAGLKIGISPALEQGEALVAQADQIIVAVRRDASVEFSTDAKFEYDGTVARVIARLDVGVNDTDGLCTIYLGS